MISNSNIVQNLVSNNCQNSSTNNTLLLSLLQALLLGCKQALRGGQSVLPLFYFVEEINPNTMTYTLVAKQQFSLNTASLGKFARLLEIILACMSNLREGKCITKRNLYYKLQQYFTDYSTLDKDIKLICHNLYYLYQQTTHSCHISTITKSMLGVIASQRCIMFGNASVTADGRLLSCGQAPTFDIITVPTCKQVQAKSLVNRIIIVEKESFFYELVTIFKRFQLADRYLLISGRGYPDLNTRELLLQLSSQTEPQIQTIYYLGDHDVYGLDIFLFYALGDWSCKGILSKIQLLEIGSPSNSQYFNYKNLKQEMNRFTKQDNKKIKEVWEKLSKLRKAIQKVQDVGVTLKINQIMEYFQQFRTKDSKCQLQLYNDHAMDVLWVHEIIKAQEKQLL